MIEVFAHGPGPTSVEGASARSFSDVDEALNALGRSEADGVILCPAGADLARFVEYLPRDASSFDVLHSGLLLGGAGTFALPQLASLDWLLLDPDPSRRSTSWKATTSLAFIRPAAVRAVGGVDAAFSSADARLMDLSYRILNAGGRVTHDPRWAGAVDRPTPVSIPLADELTFMLRHTNAFRAGYAAAWDAILGPGPVRSVGAFARALGTVRRHPRPAREPSGDESGFAARRSQADRVGAVSAIIPTIGRYEYLEKSIRSLLTQSPGPDEILVVDQNLGEERRLEFYERFADAEVPVRVLFSDRAGQCTARNLGIAEAAHDWCLLFEDDTEAWDGLLAKHIELVNAYGASVSTGVSLAPWKSTEAIDRRNRHPHLCSVLATGNCLVRKAAVVEVGGLDLAFDRGSGADNDLGTRLYKAGVEIYFNPEAIQTHHKAPRGGMRTHGAWWRFHARPFDAFPPPTQVYTIRRHYPRRAWPALYLLYFLLAMPDLGPAGKIWHVLASPWRFLRALSLSNRLGTWPGLETDHAARPCLIEGVEP